MYYKVIFNDRVIDVLHNLIYVKHQAKHNVMVICDVDDMPEAIMSSDGAYIWHVDGLYNMKVDGYDTVQLVEIDRYEYEQLKMLNLRTPEQIVDAYTLYLIEEGVL